MLCSNGVQTTSLRKQIKRKGGQAIPPTTYRGGGILAQFLMKIERFDGPYSFLSNFYPAEVTWNHMRFPCVENAYQAAKCVNPSDRLAFQTLKPGQAKRVGRTVLCRSDWDDVKIDIMTNLISQKFTLHPQLKSRLLDTGDMELIEGNYWRDFFWGVCNGRGENHLGKILMQVRKDLRKQSE